ncbi:MAG: autotransporter-associated beta strand repeat-containing protein [Bacteroidales bacterium]|nr:autotransporter-associated beta strand repeat-containing protein [Bacteroidales bacterium]
MTISLLFIFAEAGAQRMMEKLDRGLLAVKVPEGVYISWRVPGTEWQNVSYNLYADGTKINMSPVTGASCFLDTTGTINTAYYVTAIVGGVEQPSSDTIPVWEKAYKDIPVRDIPGNYELNDASVGDLDGDGDLEIVIKRLSNDVSQDPEYTSLIEAYHLDGTFIWSIDLGPNRFNPKPINFAVYDFNGDGKAEIVLKSAEGTIDGTGVKTGDVNGDGITNYRFSIAGNDISEGPEFISVYDGNSGKEIARSDYIAREPIEQWGEPGMSLTQYAHRSGSCMITPAYLDGKHPSIVISRGIYHRIKLSAWDLRNDSLVRIWDFDSDNWPAEYKGQGNHNLSVADVDNDGKDEIIYGSMTIDDDGTGLYSTGLGHGDAIHVSDMDPDRKGLEIWQAQETSPGATYRDAGTGEILYRYKAGSDQGRACAGDITAEHRGFEMWGSTGCPLFSCQDGVIGLSPKQMNFMIWWDGDLLREMLDHIWLGEAVGAGTGTITKYNGTQDGINLLTATGTYSTNWTKGNPCLQADILGDWREEVIWRTTDNRYMRIYTTTIPTDHRIYTPMHDPQYRLAIAWQNNAYNQPPHPGYYIGNGMTTIPPPPLSNAKLTWSNGNVWDINTSKNWVHADSLAVFQNGDDVLFDISGSNQTTISLQGTLMPTAVTVFSPKDYTFGGTGTLSGSMDLLKSGSGVLTIHTNNDYSGKTVVWDGSLFMNGMLKNSPVEVHKFANTGGCGVFGKGLTVLEKGNLTVGQSSGSADTLGISYSLTLGENVNVYFDLSDDTTGIYKTNDVIIIDGDLNINGKIAIHINRTDGYLKTGPYTLFQFSGELKGEPDDFSIEGIPGVPYKLYKTDSTFGIDITPVRKPCKIIWKGGISNNWDLANNLAWLNNDSLDWFVGYDTVVFNDTGIPNTSINLIGTLPVSEMFVDASVDYIFNGTGNISGTGKLVKTGSGKLTILNNNDYTGPTLINEGTLEIPRFEKAGYPSPIGAGSPDPDNLLLNGGRINLFGSSCITDKGVTIGPGGGTVTIGSSGTNVEIAGLIKGNGALTKTGLGTLAITSANNYSGGTYLKEGTIYLAGDEANISGLGTGSVTIENAILKMFDNTGYTDNCGWNMIIPEGKHAHLYLDSRSSLTGSLTGTGMLHLFSPWIRSELRGNWSDFAGEINVSTDADGGTFLIDNTYGYPDASVFLEDNVTALYRRTANITIDIGELAGTFLSRLGAGGERTSTITWRIGGTNTDAVFNGVICNDQVKNSGATCAITKTGTGTWVLTNDNTYSGSTIVEKGMLMVNNVTGSGTGTGNVLVKNGAMLSGTGIIRGSVTVESGGTLVPGNKGIGKIKVNSNVTFMPGSCLSIELNSPELSGDILEVDGSLTLNGILNIAHPGPGKFAAGDSFKIIETDICAGAFTSIMPASPGPGLVWDTTILRGNGVLKIAEVSGLHDTEHQKKIQTYPNPAKNLLSVRLAEIVADFHLQIENLNGQIVYEASKNNVSEYEIDLSGFLPGIYTLRFILDRKICVDKFIKD